MFSEATLEYSSQILKSPTLILHQNMFTYHHINPPEPPDVLQGNNPKQTEHTGRSVWNFWESKMFLRSFVHDSTTFLKKSTIIP